MVAPLFAVIGLFVLWSGYWLFARSVAIDTFTDRRAELAERGLALSCGEEAWGGYPFRFEFSCAGPEITAPQGLGLKGSTLLAIAQAYDPRHVILLFDGPSEVAHQGHDEQASHGRMIASFRFLSEGGVEVSAEVLRLAVAGRASADLVQFFLRPAATGGLDLSAVAERVVVSEQGRSPFAFDRAQVTGILDSDHRLAISALSLEAGTVRIQGTGEIALDASRRLSGELTLETNDVPGLVALIEPHLKLGEQERNLAMGVLAMLAATGPVTVAARDGALYVGPAKISELAPLY